jgi:hypothetical protein
VGLQVTLLLFGVRVCWVTGSMPLSAKARVHPRAPACRGVVAFPIMVRCDPAVDRSRRSQVSPSRPARSAPVRGIASGTVTLPLTTPGVLGCGHQVPVAPSSEFGAVITFAANVPGETRTLPLADLQHAGTPKARQCFQLTKRRLRRRSRAVGRRVPGRRAALAALCRDVRYRVHCAKRLCCDGFAL